MKIKFNILLIAFCLILFCFTGSAYASEDFKLNQFVYEGCTPVGIVVASGSDAAHRQALVFFVDDRFLDEFNNKNGDISKFFRINGYQVILNKPSYGSYIARYYKQDNEGDDWSIISTKSASASSSQQIIAADRVFNADTVLYSSIDLYNSKDELFFPKTPTVLTLEPVELGELAEKITGTMGEITIIAVSCLALLILLPLFWKVLFRFL